MAAIAAAARVVIGRQCNNLGRNHGRGDVPVKYNSIVLRQMLGGGAMSSTFRETLACQNPLRNRVNNDLGFLRPVKVGNFLHASVIFGETAAFNARRPEFAK